MCPNCGYCPHCGRSHQAQPTWRWLQPTYPTYPTGPIWVTPQWITGTVITGGHFVPSNTTNAQAPITFTQNNTGNANA